MNLIEPKKDSSMSKQEIKNLKVSKLSVYIIAFTKKNFKVSTDMEFTLFRFLHNIGISILEGEIWIES